MMTKETCLKLFTKLYEDSDSCIYANYKLKNYIPEQVIEDAYANGYESAIINVIKTDFVDTYMDICGCGRRPWVLENIYELLVYLRDRDEHDFDKDQLDIHIKLPEFFQGNNLEAWADQSWCNLYTLYSLDSIGMIEHGFSIYNPWISDLGEDFLLLFEDREFDYSIEY